MRILVSIIHPFDIYYFARLFELASRNFKIHTHAVVAKLGYLEKIENLEAILGEFFDSYELFSPATVPVYGRDVFRTLRKAKFLQKKIVRHKQTCEAAFLLDKSTLWSNIIIGNFDDVALLQAEDKVNLKEYRRAHLKTLAVTVYNFFSGGLPAGIYLGRQSKGHLMQFCLADGRFEVFKISGKSPARIQLPTVPNAGTGKSVLILGNRYLDWNFWGESKEEGLEIIREIYAELFKRYSEVPIYYKPHPMETGAEFSELNKIAQGQLGLESATVSAEMLLLRKVDIGYCFSIGSTASRSAHEMGYPSQVFFRQLPLPASVMSSFDGIFEGLPESFFYSPSEGFRDEAGNAPSAGTLGALADFFTRLS